MTSQVKRLAAVAAYLVVGAVVGWFVWEVLASETLCTRLLGPGFWDWLPGLSIGACAAIGWAFIGVLAGLWHRLGTGPWPSLPLLVLGAEALPEGEVVAPYLLIVALAASAALTVGLARCEPEAEPQPHARWRRGLWAVAAMALVYFAAFTTMSFLQYAALNVSDTDTTSFDRMLWFTLRGRVLYTGESSFFGDHMQPILFVLLPFYWLWPGLRVLMLLQTLALASGAFAVYGLARPRLSDGLAVAVAAAYLLYPPMQFINLEGTYNTFRPISFAVPLLLWAILFLDRGRLWGCAACVLGALMCKEEFGLTVFAFGLYAALKYRHWRWGGVVSALGLAWFFVSVVVVIPHFRGGSLRFMPHYAHLGPSPTEVACTVALHPIAALESSPFVEQAAFLLALLSPLGLLPLLGWECLLVATPALVYSFLSNRPAQRSILFHYHAPIVPFCAAGAVFGAERVASWSRRCGRPRAGQLAAGTLALAAALLASLLLSKSPLSLSFWNRRSAHSFRLYAITAHAEILREVRKLIPATASLEASNFVSAHFVHREHLARYPAPEADADYVLVDLKERWLDRAAARADLRRRISSGGYEVLFERGGFVLLGRLGARP